MFLISCADETDNNQTVTNATTEAVQEPAETDMKSLREAVSDDLPAKTYDGTDFIMMVRTDIVDDFYMEEQSGEVVDDAVFERNLAVETRFDIKFSVYPVAGGWNDQNTYLGAIRSSVQSDDDAFELIDGYAAYIATFAGEKMFGNWKDMAYNDADKPWWSPSAAEELTINNRLYFLTGDFALSLWSRLFVIFFNKTLAEDYSIPNMYEIVRNGEWTLDKLGELSATVSGDLDGNGTLDEKDLYGFATERGTYMDTLHICFDKQITVRGDDGIPVLNIMSEEMIDMSDKLSDLLYNNVGVYSKPEDGNGGILGALFEEGRVLFSPHFLSSVEVYRYLDVDFGIIPSPKFDEKQEDYKSASQDGHTLFCYPVTVNDLERCSIIVEALAAESYKKVVPAYYEIALKTKYSRDYESAEMLDLIRDKLCYNFGSVNSVSLGGPTQIIRSAVATSNASYASLAKQKEKMITKNLEKLLKVYLED